jgi:secreted trypsin-like serine protease
LHLGTTIFIHCLYKRIVIMMTSEINSMLFIILLINGISDASAHSSMSAGCGSRKFEQDLASFGRIVRGHDAVRGSLPWQAMLLGDERFCCGGTIIAKNWILTAAHCIEDCGMKLEIRVGKHQRDNPEGRGQIQSVNRNMVIVHPRYRERAEVDNDIALIELCTELKFNDYVQPACLPKEDADYAEGNMVIVSGWGQTVDGHNANTLQVAAVPLISQRNCESYYDPPARHNWIITDSMFCAGNHIDPENHINNENKIGTCYGDSGGPLVDNVNGKYTVLGITSWGHHDYGCGYPGVYTRTAKFESWIKSTIAKDVNIATIKEVDIKGGHAGASSQWNGDWAAKYAFKSSGNNVAWYSGNSDNSNHPEDFPLYLWYDFEKPFRPADISFRPQPGPPRRFDDEVTKFQFIGTNDKTCNKNSSWTVLCEDLSGKPFANSLETHFCLVKDSDYTTFRCLGLRILASYTRHKYYIGYASVSNIRMWERI